MRHSIKMKTKGPYPKILISCIKDSELEHARKNGK